ncbi:MAG: hypothetical protein AAB036_12050 [Elusimicrobiota bacterium]
MKINTSSSVTVHVVGLCAAVFCAAFVQASPLELAAAGSETSFAAAYHSFVGGMKGAPQGVVTPVNSVVDNNMSESEILAVLQGQGLDEKTSREIVAALRAQSPDRPLAISGMLYSSGINGAFFVDTDDWSFDASFKDEKTGKLVKVPGLYNVTFNDGGVKIEVVYKWIFVFLTSDMTVHTLDKAVFGRGLGLTIGGLGPMIDIEAMFASNRPGFAIVAAPKIGIGGGVMFPKMTFSLAPAK